MTILAFNDTAALAARNSRHTDAVTADEYGNYLADCDEIETVFAAAFNAILQNIKLRGLGFMRADELGVRREVPETAVALRMAEAAVEAMYDDLDSLSIARLKRFGFPSLQAPKVA